MSTLTTPPFPTPAVAVPGPLCELARYVDDAGSPRRIATFTRADASVLVLDTPPRGVCGARVLAELAPDEPHDNARLVCEMYLADDSRGRCRALTAGDLDPTSSALPAVVDPALSPDAVLRDADGRGYAIRPVDAGGLPQLGWTHASDGDRQRCGERLTLRDVVGALEDYEPARSMTVAALARAAGNPELSTHRLRGELERLLCSPVVLNRALREALQQTAAHGETSLSEIAERCGRLKRDRRGNVSGETSWLARRTGQMPDSGAAAPSRWVHSDVLARIARDGLGVLPCEVEV